MRGARKTDPDVHVFGNGIVCELTLADTLHQMVKASLTCSHCLRRFHSAVGQGHNATLTISRTFITRFESPSAAKTAIRKLLGKALLACGDAAPIKFSEQNDAWDFEIAVRDSDRCISTGAF